MVDVGRQPVSSSSFGFPPSLPRSLQRQHSRSDRTLPLPRNSRLDSCIMPRSKCQLCHSARAILRRPKTSQQVCKACFFYVFEEEVHNTITQAHLFQKGDRVAIGASGGKGTSTGHRYRPAPLVDRGGGNRADLTRPSACSRIVRSKQIRRFSHTS